MLTVRFNGHPVVGFSEEAQDALVTPPAPKPESPWPMVFISSIVSAATGWAIEGAARRVRGKR